MAQPAASAPGPRQAAHRQPPLPSDKLRSTPVPVIPQLAPGYDVLPSQPYGPHQKLQKSPGTSPLSSFQAPLAPHPVLAPSPEQSITGFPHRMGATGGSKARPPAVLAAAAAAPAGAAAAGPAGQTGQTGNTTTAEPLHARSLAPAIQEGTLDLHGNGTIVHSSSVSAPPAVLRPLWNVTVRPSSKLSLASVLG